MKVSKAQAAENRAALVTIASRRLREQGFDGIATSEIAKAASLTHGALYSHFKTKEALAAEGLTEAFRECHGNFAKLDAQGWLEAYLSIGHRDAPDQGCPMAALVSEVPHQGEAIQERFAAGADAFVGLAGETFGAPERPAAETRSDALFKVAAMMGGLALSRALRTADPVLSEAVLGAVRDRLLGPSAA